jgi:hypothetical protein
MPLESLLDDHLLQQDAPERYYFHDLVRECARRGPVRGAVAAAHSVGDERGESLARTGPALALREHRCYPEAHHQLTTAIAMSRRSGVRRTETYQLAESGTIRVTGEQVG